MLFLTAPTVIAILDDSIDISFIYSTSEEEEKSNEKNKDIDLKFYDLLDDESDFVLTKTEHIQSYFFKNYPKPHLNLISPPPELNIL